MLRIVLDTNIILAAALPESKYRKIIRDFLEEKYSLLISPEIVFEYEEKLVEIYNRETANQFFISLFNSSNLVRVNPFFDFRLI
ncbi:MAG: putative toxin-antitoxin system toxin component, PIN family, partial [Bacteroidia bacterium]